MKLLALVVLVLSCRASAVEFPAGYWDRGYGTSQANIYYNVQLRVRNLARAEAEVDKRLSKAGGSMKSANSGYYSSANSSNQKQRSLSYTLDAGKAEAIVKSLFDLGDLQSYNNQKQIQSSQLDELRTKVKQIEEELREHAEPLKRMPISSFFLNRQLASLKQSLESYEASASKAAVNVTLTEQVSEK
jgi:hypothetical protein